MKLLACSLFVLLAVVSPSLATGVGSPIYEEWWQDRFNSNVENSRVNGANINLLFLGDAIVEGWPAAIWNRAFAPLGAANYGIIGDLTWNVLFRIENGEVDNISPRLVVLNTGTNNFGTNSSAEIAVCVETIVNELRTRLPTTRILLLGILPRTDEATTEMAEETNRIISTLDNLNTVRFLNMRDSFYAGNGQFISELFSNAHDPLHLSNLGYLRWEETMYPLFNQMWNAPQLQ